MLNFEGACTTDTGLRLGSASLLDKTHHEKNHLQSHRRPQQNHKKKLSTLKFDHSFPSLTLGLSSPSSSLEEKYVKFDASTGEVGGASTVLYRLQSSQSSVSAVTSYSGVNKRERDLCGEEDREVGKISPKVSDDRDEAGTAARKKLKLTREQSGVLEDSFKEHTTLNPKRKQDLANQLNIQTRQVEVWFQNRRARTKLKQTERECELLKKCCQTLTDENQKLEKELQELKELYKESAPLLHMQMPAVATLTMCPFCCERTGGDGGFVGGGSGENSSTRPFSNIGLKPQSYNPFTHPSAAC